MRYNTILVKYGELTLKGNNREEFEKALADNIYYKLPNIKITRTVGRMYINLDESTDSQPILEVLGKTFGLSGFVPALKLSYDVRNHQESMDIIKENALALLRETWQDSKTFKVVSRRVNKSFTLKSSEINAEVGAHLLRNMPQASVDVSSPNLIINIELREKHIYLYSSTKLQAGLGGLTSGISGRALLLLSGGIDSPVAGYLAMKRGVELHAVYFHSPPFTSERAKQKVIDLAKILSGYTSKVHLYIVPFTQIQLAIKERCRPAYSITLMRRAMMRIAVELAESRQALALITGESLGQVASQTLESISVVNQVTNMPIFRPLIGMDKSEITTLAKQIGTYETSVLPYEDCCTIFLPRSPKIRPKLHESQRQEECFELTQLISEAVSNVEVITLDSMQNNQSQTSYF